MNRSAIRKAGKRDYLMLVVMIYVAAFIFCDVMVKRMIGTNHLYTSGAIIGFPLTFTIADVVAEVYGYQIARNMIWYGFIADFVFDMLVTFTLHLPFPKFWVYTSSFYEVLGNLPFLFLISIVAAPASDFFNIYIIAKTKILFKGRGFVLRSIIASALGELSDTLIIGTLLTFLYHWEGHEWTIMGLIYVFKILYSLISAFPAAACAALLKKYEGIDVYDNSTDFNPFKLKIDSGE